MLGASCSRARLQQRTEGALANCAVSHTANHHHHLHPNARASFGCPWSCCRPLHLCWPSVGLIAGQKATRRPTLGQHRGKAARRSRLPRPLPPSSTAWSPSTCSCLHAQLLATLAHTQRLRPQHTRSCLRPQHTRSCLHPSTHRVAVDAFDGPEVDRAQCILWQPVHGPLLS